MVYSNVCKITLLVNADSRLVNAVLCHINILLGPTYNTASNITASLNQKSWTLYKMYWRLANGILMGTLRSESRGVYDCGGSNVVYMT